ncbi:ORF6N domain-containing protein [Bacteroidota bacterium]
MTYKNIEISIPDEVIRSKIYLIRGRKVMLDRDLAELYGVETKQLKRTVRRNIERFPEDFMFEMTKEELEDWRCQFGTSNKERMGLRVPPFVFSEHGAEHDNNILLIFEYIKQLEQKNQHQTDQQNRKRIGFKRHGD